MPGTAMVLTLPSYHESKLVLLRYRLPVEYQEARAYIEARLESIRMLDLYHRYFPQEYAASQAPLSSPEGWAYTPREEEFLHLVEDRLFPLPLDWMLDGLDPEERVPIIPVMPLGMDWCNGDTPFSEVSLGWQLLLLLGGYAGEDDGGELNVEGEGAEVEASRLLKETLWGMGDDALRGDLDFKELMETCGRAGEPLAHLPLALTLLEHNTGNVWFDYTDESPCQDMVWCEQDIDFLTREYREARDMDARVDSLLLWIEADPRARFQEVIECWNQATH